MDPQVKLKQVPDFQAPNPQGANPQGQENPQGHGFRFGQGIRQYQRPGITGAPDNGAGTPATPGTGIRQPNTPSVMGDFAPSMQVYRSASSQQLANLREEMARRRNDLMQKFSANLEAEEKKLLEQAATARSLRDGAKSNWNNDIIERDKITKSYNPLLWVAANWISDTRDSLDKQVAMSERMYNDHVERVKKIEAAIGTQDDLKQARQQTLTHLERVFKAEEERVRLYEERRRAADANDTQKMSVLDEQIKNQELAVKNANTAAEKALEGIGRRFAAGDPSELFAKHRHELRSMNEEFDKNIQSLNTFETYGRLYIEVAIVVVAGGAATIATGGLAAGPILSLLYGAGVGALGGMTMRAATKGAEYLGGATYGNYSDAQLGQMRDNFASEVAWSGLECGLAGMGAGWASRAARVQQTVLKAVSHGRYTPGLWGFNGACYRNSFTLWRRTNAVRNAWRMTTPSTAFHTAKDVFSGKLAEDPSKVISNVVGNYALAGLCGGNSAISHQCRQSLSSVGFRELLRSGTLRQLFSGTNTFRAAQATLGVVTRKSAQVGVYGLEGFVDYLAVKHGITELDKWLGRPVDSPEYQYEREQRIKMSVLGHLTGGFTNLTSHRQGAQVQTKVDTLADGLSTVATNRHAATGRQGVAPRIEVESASGTTSPRLSTARDGTHVARVTMDDTHTPREARVLQGQTERRVALAVDDGYVDSTVQNIRGRTVIGGRGNQQPEVDADGTTTATTRLTRAEATDVNQTLFGARQRAPEVQATLQRALGNTIDEANAARLAREISSTRRTASEKLELINNDVVRRGGQPLTDSQRVQLSRRLGNDTEGDVTHAILRGSEIDQTASDPAVLRSQAEAALRKLTAEAEQHNADYAAGRRTRTHEERSAPGSTPGEDGGIGSFPGIRNAFDARWNSIRQMGWGIGPTARFLERSFTTVKGIVGIDGDIGWFPGTRNAFGARWNSIRQMGWGIGPTARFLEGSFTTIKGIVGIEANTILGMVTNSPFAAPVSMLVDVPLAGISGMRNLKNKILDLGSAPLRFAGSLRASPTDAVRAIGHEEQLQSYLNYATRLQEQGVTIDPTVIQAAQNQLRASQRTFNQANTSFRLSWRGRVRGQLFADDSPELRSIRLAFRDATNEGLQFSPEAQLTAYRNQGLRMIQQSAAPEQFEAFIALGRDRFTAPVMRQMTDEFTASINQLYTGTGRGAPPPGPRSGAPLSAESRGFFMRYRGPTRGPATTDPTAPTGPRDPSVGPGLRQVMDSYNDPTRRPTLRRDPNMTEGSLYRQERIALVRDTIDGPGGWLATRGRDGLDAAYESLASMQNLGTDRASRAFYRNQLRDLDRRLQFAEQQARSAGETSFANNVRTLRDAVRGRRQFAATESRRADTAPTAAQMQTDLTNSINTLRQRSGGERFYTAAHEVDQLQAVRGDLNFRRTRLGAAPADDPRRTLLNEKITALDEMIANAQRRAAARPLDQEIFSPVLQHFRVAAGQPQAPTDILQMPLVRREWDFIAGREVLRADQNRTLGSESQRGAWGRMWDIANSRW